MRKLKKAFAFAMACSTPTRTLANRVLQARYETVSGWPLRAFVGLKRKQGIT